MIRPNRSFTVACARKKFESMAPFTPDLIVTNCPGCGLVLDREQWAVNQLTGAKFQIPCSTTQSWQVCFSAGTPTTSWGYRAIPCLWKPLGENWHPSVAAAGYLRDDAEIATAVNLRQREPGEMNSLY